MVCLFKNVSETSDVSAEKSSRNHIKTSLPAIEIPCKYGNFFYTSMVKTRERHLTSEVWNMTIPVPALPSRGRGRGGPHLTMYIPVDSSDNR